MITLTVWFVLSVVVEGLAEPLSVGSLVDCSPGHIWVKDNIHYTCFESRSSTSLTRGYKPTGCVTETGQVINPGTTVKDANFKYSCDKFDEDTLVYSIKSCITPSKTEMKVGDKVFEDGGTYFCNTEADGSVSRTFTKETQCSYNGKKYDLNALWVDGSVKLLCYQSGGKLVVRAEYCITTSGAAIKVGSSGKVENAYVSCVRDTKDPAKALLQALTSTTCKDVNGTMKNLNDKWDDGVMQYQCALVGLTTTVKTIACVFQPDPKNAMGKSLIPTYGYTITTDKKYYWCKSYGNNTYRATFLPDELMSCSTKDKNYTVNEFRDTDGIRYKCSYYIGFVSWVQVGCVITVANGKIVFVPRGQINETSPGVAFKCEPDKKGNLISRQLSDIEYLVWKGENSVSGKGSKGAGAEGTRACGVGFTLNGAVCVDINECALDIDNCTDKEDCQNTNGSFICSCKPGYRMVPNDGCVDVNECSEGTANCSSLEKCINKEPGFECVCKDGYHRSHAGKMCEDVDECAEKIVTCHEHQTCVNSVGSYKCVCDSGYIEVNGSCATLTTTATPATTTTTTIATKSTEKNRNADDDARREHVPHAKSHLDEKNQSPVLSDKVHINDERVKYLNPNVDVLTDTSHDRQCPCERIIIH